MRFPPSLFSSLVFCLLLAGSASAGAGAGAGELASRAAPDARATAGLAMRYLPAATPRVSVAALSLEMPTRWARVLRTYTDTPTLPSLLELRLRTLGDADPPDPRRRLSSGDVRLRLPLGDTFDVSPGVRLDYARHPQDDLWTGDPTPTLSISMRF